MTYQDQLEIERKHWEKSEEILKEKEALIEYYKTHTQKETLTEFGIDNVNQLRKILAAAGFDFEYKKRHTARKGRPAIRSHESYVEAGKKSSATQIASWANKSENEKQAWSEKQSLAHQTSHYRYVSSENNTRYWNSLSDSEKAKVLEKRSNSLKSYWDSLPTEVKTERINTIMSSGGGWNHDTIKNTNLEKYGVENQFMRTDVDWNYNHQNSGPNLMFKSKLDEAGINYEVEFPIDNRAYDFKVGDTLIEINPSATHNSTWGIHGGAPKDKRYHYNKSELAITNGYRCIQVWDWDNIDAIINLIKPRETVYARVCEIKEVSKQDAVEFINNNHIQGYAKDETRLGLYLNNELISIMTFGKPRYNKHYQYELVRYCSTKNVIGGAEKLFSHFIDDYKPKSIISYCDLSKFSGDTYEKLGFELLSKSKGSRHWYNLRTGRHITDNMLRKLGADKLLGTSFGKGTSNRDIMLDNKFIEVYDCGQATYVKSV